MKATVSTREGTGQANIREMASGLEREGEAGARNQFNKTGCGGKWINDRSMAKLKIAGMDYNGWLALRLNPRLWSGAPTQRDHLPSGLNSWLQQSLTRANFSKRIFATSRTANCWIWTILRRSKAGPRGHILGTFRAPGGPRRNQGNTPKHCWGILSGT